MVDLFERIESRPRADLLRYKAAGSYLDVSTEEFATRARRLATFLVDSGVAPGDRVAILSENRPEWTISDFAIQLAGAVNVPVYTTLSAEQIRYILTNSEARIVLTSRADLLETVITTAGGAPSLRRAIVFDPIAGPSPSAGGAPSAEAAASWPVDTVALADAYERGGEPRPENAGRLEERMKGASPEDLASIIYTSGTTGDPKGVMLTHANFCSNIDTCLDLIPFHPSDVALSFLPLSHVFERAVEYMYLAAGGSIAYAESLEKVASNILEVRPTVLASVPRVLEKIHGRVLDKVRTESSLKRRIFEWSMAAGRRRLHHTLSRTPVPPLTELQFKIADRLVFSKLRERLGGRVRFLVSGGAPLPREIAEFFLSAGITVLEGYGLTETSPVVAVNTLERLRPGTVGPVIPKVDVKIAEDSEILVRGPNVMKGYFRNPDATRQVLRDGYFATGDIGFIDKDGFLTITDRKKDLIVTSGGKNVAPQPIENAIKASRYIANAVLFGDRRNFISALIVPDFQALEEFSLDRGLGRLEPAHLIARSEVKELIEKEVEAATARFAQYEKVKKLTLLERDFTLEGGEMTPTLKVKRRVIQERYRSLIEAMYRS